MNRSLGSRPGRGCTQPPSLRGTPCVFLGQRFRPLPVRGTQDGTTPTPPLPCGGTPRLHPGSGRTDTTSPGTPKVRVLRSPVTPAPNTHDPVSPDTNPTPGPPVRSGPSCRTPCTRREFSSSQDSEEGCTVRVPSRDSLVPGGSSPTAVPQRYGQNPVSVSDRTRSSYPRIYFGTKHRKRLRTPYLYGWTGGTREYPGTPDRG